MNLKRIIREELNNDLDSLDWLHHEMGPRYVDFNRLNLECDRYYVFYFYPEISVSEVRTIIMPSIESYFGPIKKTNFKVLKSDTIIDHLEIHEKPNFEQVLIGNINARSEEELINNMHDSDCGEGAIYDGRQYFGL